jgi:hypothetical protein
LVIRKEEQNNVKSPFGWKLIGDEPINIHALTVTSTSSPDDVRRVVLQMLKRKWRIQFTEKGVLYRAFKSLSPERMDEL